MLVVSDRWPALTLGLRRRGARRRSVVLGVFDPDEPAGKDHLVDARRRRDDRRRRRRWPSSSSCSASSTPARRDRVDRAAGSAPAPRRLATPKSGTAGRRCPGPRERRVTEVALGAGRRVGATGAAPVVLRRRARGGARGRGPARSRARAQPAQRGRRVRARPRRARRLRSSRPLRAAVRLGVVAGFPSAVAAAQVTHAGRARRRRRAARRATTRRVVDVDGASPTGRSRCSTAPTAVVGVVARRARSASSEALEWRRHRASAQPDHAAAPRGEPRTAQSVPAGGDPSRDRAHVRARRRSRWVPARPRRRGGRVGRRARRRAVRSAPRCEHARRCRSPREPTGCGPADGGRDDRRRLRRDPARRARADRAPTAPARRRPRRGARARSIAAVDAYQRRRATSARRSRSSTRRRWPTACCGRSPTSVR